MQWVLHFSAFILGVHTFSIHNFHVNVNHVLSMNGCADKHVTLYMGHDTCHAVPIRDATGKFPDYPDDDEGGSEAIFKKREEPVSIHLCNTHTCFICLLFSFLFSVICTENRG